jgi:hypothetical protein
MSIGCESFMRLEGRNRVQGAPTGRADAGILADTAKRRNTASMGAALE